MNQIFNVIFLLGLPFTLLAQSKIPKKQQHNAWLLGGGGTFGVPSTFTQGTGVFVFKNLWGVSLDGRASIPKTKNVPVSFNSFCPLGNCSPRDFSGIISICAVREFGFHQQNSKILLEIGPSFNYFRKQVFIEDPDLGAGYYESKLTSRGVGITSKIQIVVTPFNKQFGFGVGIFGNLNNRQSTGGLMISWNYSRLNNHKLNEN